MRKCNQCTTFLISNFCCVFNVICFFWIIPWRLQFKCQSFGTLCLFHLHGRVGMKLDCS
jgi:hypothetical protein